MTEVLVLNWLSATDRKPELNEDPVLGGADFIFCPDSRNPFIVKDTCLGCEPLRKSSGFGTTPGQLSSP